ncbi:MAG TPA: translocation/assembly module TamB domain-containing protein [Bacillota bacterium]|nr:translocation/assembly module TamB domain-containing protein [Bacillota bacterium]
MQQRFSKWIWVVVAVLAVVGGLLQTPPFFLVKDQQLLNQINGQLKKVFLQNGLELNIGKIRWQKWDTLTASGIQLREAKGQQIPLELQQLTIKVDLLTLLKKRHHPEASLREIVLVDSRVELERYQDGTWNIQRYFSGKGRKSELQTIVRLENATIEYRDARFGAYRIHKVYGTVDFCNYPGVIWKVRGKIDLETSIAWDSRGETHLGKKVGMGQIHFKQMPVEPVVSLIPALQSYRVASGLADGHVKFAWNPQKFWLDSGAFTLQDAQVYLPGFAEAFRIERLKAAVSPKEVHVGYGKIRYKKAQMDISGNINTDTTAMAADISVRQFALADLKQFVTQVSPYALDGSADLKLKLSGQIGKPILDGEVRLSNATVTMMERPITDISGDLKIVNNDLLINEFEGQYQQATVGLSGKIFNLFNPRFDLAVYGWGLDLSELTAQYPKLHLGKNPKTDFRGRIDGNWRRPLFSGELSVAGVTYESLQADNLNLNFAWNFREKILQILDLEAGVYGGQVNLKGNVRFSETGAVWEFSSRASGVDIGQNSWIETYQLAGMVSVDAMIKGSWQRGQPFDIGTVFGVLKGNHIQYRQAVSDEVQAVFTWKDQGLRIDSIRMNLEKGRIYGHIAWRSQRLEADLSVEDVRLRDVWPVSGDHLVDGVFKGDIILEGPVDDLYGRAIGKVSQVQWGSQNAGDISGEVLYRGGRFDIEMVDVNSPFGDFRLKGHIGIADGAPLQLSVIGDAIELNKLVRWFSLDKQIALHGNGQVQLEVTGTTDSPRYSGQVTLFRPKLYTWELDDGIIRFNGDLNQFHIEEFKLHGEGSNIQMSGSLAHDRLEMKYSGYIDDIKSLGLYYKGNIGQGKISFHGLIRGTAEKPMITATLNGTTLSFGSIKDKDLVAHLRLNQSDLEIEELRLIGADGSIEANGTISLAKPEKVQLSARLSQIQIEPFISALKLQNVQATGSLSGNISVQGLLTNPLVAFEGRLDQGSLNGYPVNGIFDLRYDRNNLHFERIELRHQNGTLLANGGWEEGKVLRLKALLVDFPVQPVAALIRKDLQLDGNAHGEFRLEWSKAGISGDYQCQIFNLGVNGISLGQMTLGGRYSERGISVTSGSLSYQGGRVSVEGFIPWSETFVSKLDLPVQHKLEQNVDLRFLIRELPTEILNGISNQFQLSKGRINGDIRMTGSWANPILSGRLSSTPGGLDLPELPLTVENFETKLIIISNQVQLENVSGTIKRGKFTMTGQMVLERFVPKNVSLHLAGSKVYYHNRFFNGYGDVQLDITGNLFENPKIAGDVTVYDCKIGVSGGRGNGPGKWQPEYDITLKAGKNVRYRQLGIADVTVNGELYFRGNAMQPKLIGKVSSKKGVLTLYGQNFMVKSGEVVFRPEHGLKPYIDIDTTCRTTKAEVFLSIKGQVGEDVVINLSSRPQMSQSQIYALLNWSELSGDEPLTLEGMIGGNLSFVTDTLFGDVFGEIRNTLHLDYLYLETNYAQNELRIYMGDYITDELFLSYSRSVYADEPNEIWGFDYHLTPQFTLGGRYSAEEDELSWRLTYGFEF